MSVDFVIPVSSPTGSGTTLRRYRRRLADELGWLLLTTTSAVASHGDPSRVVLADELRDDEAGYGLSPGPPWLYVRDGAQAGTQRRVLSQGGVGYQGQRSALVLSRPFAAPLGSGVTIEATWPLPVKRHLGTKGLDDLVNEALAEIKVAMVATFTGNGTTSHDLAPTPYIRTMSDVVGIRDTQWLGSSDAPDYSPYTARIVTNGVTRTLVTENLYSSTETFYLDVIVDADRLIHDGSSWGYQTGETVGLQADTHQAAAPENHVLAFGMANAVEYLMELLENDTEMPDAIRKRRLANLERRYDRWTTVAADLKLREFPRPPMVPIRPLAAVTSARRWRR